MFNFDTAEVTALINLLEKEMRAIEDCGDDSMLDLYTVYESALSELSK